MRVCVMFCGSQSLTPATTWAAAPLCRRCSAPHPIRLFVGDACVGACGQVHRLLGNPSFREAAAAAAPLSSRFMQAGATDDVAAVQAKVRSQLAEMGQLALIHLRSRWASLGSSIPAPSLPAFVSMLGDVGIALTDDEARILLDSTGASRTPFGPWRLGSGGGG